MGPRKRPWGCGSSSKGVLRGILFPICKECCKEDESLESLMEATVNLRQSIQASEEQELPKETEEPALPSPEQITDQFNSRAIYLVGDEYDERSVSPTFWLSSPPPEDADIEADMVKCDLIDMSQKFLNDFDVKAELEKDITTSTGAPTPPGKAARKRLNKPRVEPMVPWGGRGPIQRHGNAPMRGKGYSIYSRGMAFQSRPNDVFRQRKQNTSRPPSMHVDDFLAMEDDTGPPAKRARQNESSSRGGGSGSGRGGFGRGRGGFRGNHGPEPRWLSPPGPYGRRGRDSSSNLPSPTSLELPHLSSVPVLTGPTSGATVKTERGEHVTTGNRTRVVRLAVTNANHYTKRFVLESSESDIPGAATLILSASTHRAHIGRHCKNRKGRACHNRESNPSCPLGGHQR
ncbi:hypothetical protein Bbelb_030410 [Branchiostoma belcheri]|nr:hypothetical protein Bbelb_030410 [Branchiostoma belcheri]